MALHFDPKRSMASAALRSRGNVRDQRAQQSCAHEPRCSPGREHARRHRDAGAKYDRSHGRIALRKSLQVRHVAVAEPARADRLRIPVTHEILPAIDSSPRTVTPLTERLADIAEHAFHRGEPRRLRPRRDAVLDAFDYRELRSQHVDDSGRQRRHRARAADDEHVVAPRRFIEQCRRRIRTRAHRRGRRSEHPLRYMLEQRHSPVPGTDQPCERRRSHRAAAAPPRGSSHDNRATPVLRADPTSSATALAFCRSRPATTTRSLRSAASAATTLLPEIAITAEDDRASHTTAQCKKRSAMSAVGTRHAANADRTCGND